MNATTHDNDDDLAGDLRITKTTRRASGGGTWVCQGSTRTVHGARITTQVSR